MGTTEQSLTTNEGPSAVIGQRAVAMTISGFVQGVGFRYFTRASAQRAGVVGWVRNTDDGTVEIYAEGTEQRLKQFVAAVRRGPTHSQVSDVALTWQPATGQFRSFHIRD